MIFCYFLNVKNLFEVNFGFTNVMQYLQFHFARFLIYCLPCFTLLFGSCFCSVNSYYFLGIFFSLSSNQLLIFFLLLSSLLCLILPFCLTQPSLYYNMYPLACCKLYFSCMRKDHWFSVHLWLCQLVMK